MKNFGLGLGTALGRRSGAAGAAAAQTERITGGDFSSALPWTTNGAWSISGGVCTGTDVGPFLSQALTQATAAGKSFTLSFRRIANPRNTEIGMYLYNSSTLALQLIFSSVPSAGVNTANGTCDGTYDTFLCQSTDDIDFQFDDLSLKVTP